MTSENNSKSARVRKIEVVQAIQSETNDIPLIAGKRTYVRVYLEPKNFEDITEVDGRIKVVGEAGEILTDFPSMNFALLKTGASLQEQRLEWSQSLNFQLPDNFWKGFSSPWISFELASVTATSPGGDPIILDKINGNSKTENVEVIQDLEMRCRIVMFKHRDLDNVDFLEPTAGEAAAIQRYVESTFPIGNIFWSTVTVAAPKQFRALGGITRDSDRTEEQITHSYIRFFLHLLEIREQDILNGRDPRTLYLGLLFDPSGRFGGAAMDSPQFAAPHVVALATPDSEGQLGAHELAHVLGRRHPGIPNRDIHGSLIGQRKEPNSTELEYKGKTLTIQSNGFLSNSTDGDSGGTHHGLDVRYRGSAPRILPHDKWFDLMTYRYPKWVSNLTYLGLLERLQEINGSDFSVEPPFDPSIENMQTGGESEWSWTVIGEYDLRRKTGRIHYLGPSNYKTPTPAPTPDDFKDDLTEDPIVQLAWDKGVDDGLSELAKDGVYIRNYRKLDGSRSIGVFQHTLSSDKFDTDTKSSFEKLINTNGHLKLLVEGLVVDEVQGCEEGMSVQIFDEIFGSLNTRLPDRPAPNLRRDEGAGVRTPMEGLSFQYCLDDGGYYLRYIWNWDKKETRHLRITTSIACMRENPAEKHDPVWETVMVSDRLVGRIWISPEFFKNPRYKSSYRYRSSNNDSNSEVIDDCVQHDSYGSVYHGMAYVKDQILPIRIGITIGFRTRYQTTDLEIPLTDVEAFGSRNSSSSHMQYPGNEKGDDSRSWYRDTGTEPDNYD